MPEVHHNFYRFDGETLKPQYLASVLEILSFKDLRDSKKLIKMDRGHQRDHYLYQKIIVSNIITTTMHQQKRRNGPRAQKNGYALTTSNTNTLTEWLTVSHTRKQGSTCHL